MSALSTESTLDHNGGYVNTAKDPKAASHPTLPPPALAREFKNGAPWASWDNFKDFMMEDVEPSLATLPLSAFCFMTGFM